MEVSWFLGLGLWSQVHAPVEDYDLLLKWHSPFSEEWVRIPALGLQRPDSVV